MNLFRLTPILALLAAHAVSCHKQSAPDSALCLKAHLHKIKIIGEDPLLSPDLKQIMLESLLDKRKQPAILQACIEKKTVALLECELRASTFQELRRCVPALAPE